MGLTQKIKELYSEMNWKLTGALMSTPILSELVIDNFSKYVSGTVKSPFDDVGDYIQTGFGMALMLGIGAYISHKNAEKISLKEQLVRDPLTGVYSRYYYEQNINKIIEKAKKEKQDIGFSILDLNNMR